ncbi:MAG: alpha/beta fold hydrolase [Acidimicrobiales bacterium]
MRTEAVALIHGYASSFEREWREVGWADLLGEAGRQVIGIDLLGHGAADKPHDPEAYVDLEGDVAAAFPADEKVDAIGFSLGAHVLLALACKEPDRFSRIVVAGVGAAVMIDIDTEPLAQLVSGEVITDHPIGNFFARAAALPDNDAAALAACMRAPRPVLTPELLANITCPVLVVMGDQDFAGPADPLVAALPNATLTVLKGVDHFGTPKNFGFIDAALEFLEAVPQF